MSDARDGSIFQEINTALPLRRIAAQIAGLSCSADTKALLMDMARVTVTVGTAALQIGRKILTVVFDILTRFPNTVFGVVIGVAIGLLIAATPLIGGLLAPFLTPLLIAFGLTRGAIADLATANWAGQIRDLQARLAAAGV